MKFSIRFVVISAILSQRSRRMSFSKNVFLVWICSHEFVIVGKNCLQIQMRTVTFYQQRQAKYNHTLKTDIALFTVMCHRCTDLYKEDDLNPQKVLSTLPFFLPIAMTLVLA